LYDKFRKKFVLKTIITPFKSLLTLICIVAISINSSGQKLPNKQETSLRAPATIKIDGKTTEWNNRFQAYNHATEIFYTLSNDDDKLYLTVQATDQSIINKIFKAGVTFVLTNAEKKKDKDVVSIAYPVLNGPNRLSVNVRSKKDIETGAANTAIIPDSVVRAYNRMFADRSKLISVNGIAGVDSLISVFNEDGIKAAGAFDNKMAYIYELAIDLKLLKLSANDAAKITYHIILNNAPATALPLSASNDDLSAAKLSMEFAQTSAPTDFLGEYTLAKKN
jgi:hypothetical protein